MDVATGRCWSGGLNTERGKEEDIVYGTIYSTPCIYNHNRLIYGLTIHAWLLLVVETAINLSRC